MAARTLVAAGFAAGEPLRTAMIIDAGFTRGTAGSVAHAIFIAAAIGQATLIVLAAAVAAGQGIRAARAGRPSPTCA